jgi:hypothetical protein
MGSLPLGFSAIWAAIQNRHQLADVLLKSSRDMLLKSSRAAQIEQDFADREDQYYRSRHGLIALGILSHLGCHTE